MQRPDSRVEFRHLAAGTARVPAVRPSMNGVPDEHVECGSCSACCRGQLVVLVEGDNPSAYGEAMAIPQWFTDRLRSDGVPSIGYILPMGRDGACIYLKDGKCSIYRERPIMCRAFSCIGLVRNTLANGADKREVKRRMAKGLIDPAVWKAGKQRLDAAVTAAGRLLGFAVT